MATLAAEAEQEATAANRAGAAMAAGDASAALLADSEALAMAQAQDMTLLDESMQGDDGMFEEWIWHVYNLRLSIQSTRPANGRAS